MKTGIKEHGPGSPNDRSLEGHTRIEGSFGISTPSNLAGDIKRDLLKELGLEPEAGYGWRNQVEPPKKDSSSAPLAPAKDVRFPLEPALRQALEERIEQHFEQEGLRPPLNQLLQHYAKRGLEAERAEHDKDGRLELQQEREQLALERLTLVEQKAHLATKTGKNQKLRRRLKKAMQKGQSLKEELAKLKAEQEGGVFVSYTWLVAGIAGAGLAGYGLGRPSPEKDLGKILDAFSNESDKERRAKERETSGEGLAQAPLWRFVEAQLPSMPAPLREAFNSWIIACQQSLSSQSGSTGQVASKDVM